MKAEWVDAKREQPTTSAGVPAMVQGYTNGWHHCFWSAKKSEWRFNNMYGPVDVTYWYRLPKLRRKEGA